MNANELADLLEASNDPDVRRAVAMLRILDGQLAFRIDAVTKYQEKVEEQQAEIEALKGQYKFGVDWSKDGSAVSVVRINNDGIAEVVFHHFNPSFVK